MNIPVDIGAAAVALLGAYAALVRLEVKVMRLRKDHQDLKTEQTGVAKTLQEDVKHLIAMTSEVKGQLEIVVRHLNGGTS